MSTNASTIQSFYDSTKWSDYYSNRKLTDLTNRKCFAGPSEANKLRLISLSGETILASESTVRGYVSGFIITNIQSNINGFRIKNSVKNKLIKKFSEKPLLTGKPD